MMRQKHAIANENEAGMKGLGIHRARARILPAIFHGK